MTVKKTGGSTAPQAPQAEPKKSESPSKQTTPKDSKVVKNNPQATKSAVKQNFGDVPKNDGKNSGGASGQPKTMVPKQPPSSRLATQPSPGPAGDAKTAGDPKTPTAAPDTPDPPDAQAAALRTTYPGYAGAGLSSGMPNVPLAPPPGSAPQPAGSRLAPSIATQGQYATQSMPVRIVYPEGTLKGLLDTASARFGVFWKYTNATIQFYYTDTRTFQINAVPGDSALSASVASGSTSGTNGGGTGTGGGDTQGTLSANNTQNTAVNSQLSVFGSIEKAVGAMLTPYGKVVASPATGTITVVDTPDTLDRVAQLIKAENSTLSRQVMVNVTVLSVTKSDGDNLGINWNLVYSDLFRKYGIQNTLTAQPNSNSFSAGILNTANSRWSGSSLVINALASQGKVRRETTASVVTLNNQPVPVQVATETSYLRSSQTTITANVGSTTTLDPGTFTSGFNMTILPHVLDNGTVMLQFSTDMSSLRQLRTVSSNNSTIETPELDTRNFLQRVAMKSNETLIISGFEQTDDNLQRQGTGNAHNWLFGGGYNAQSSKEVIVILITPVTMPSA